MKISKKQLRLIILLERSGGMFRHEIAESQYPQSLINALVKKELINDFKGKLTSATA